MDWTSIITAVIASIAASGLFTVLLGSRYDRSERFRERLLEATERFLAAFDDALASTLDYRLQAHFLLKNLDQAIDASGRAGEIAAKQVEGGNDRELTEAEKAAVSAITLTRDIMDIRNTLSEDGRRNVQAIVEKMESAIETLMSEPLEERDSSLSAALRSVLRTTVLFTSSIEATHQAALRTRDTVAVAENLTARIRLLFPAEGDNSVPVLAVTAASVLGELQSSIAEASQAKRDPLNDPDVTIAAQSAFEHNEQFVQAARERICRKTIKIG